MKKIYTQNIILLLLILAGIYLLNYFTPMFRDDCNYAFSHSIKEIFSEQYNAYFNANGRVISHSIVHFFAGMVGKNIFNFINPVMYIWAILLVICLASDNKKQAIAFLSLLTVFFLFWFLLPDQYVTNYMIAGSLNYLWATVLVLSYIRFFMQNTDRQFKNATLVPIFLFSFFAGAFIEMYSVCVLPAMLVYIWHNKIRLNKFVLTSVFGFAVGAAFTVFAPANFKRRGEMVNDEAGIMQKIFDILYYTSINYWWIVLLVAVIAFITRKKWQGNFKQFFKDNIFYFTAIICSLGFIALSGALYERTFFAIHIFTIILIVKWLKKIHFSRKTKQIFVILLSLILAFSYVYELNTARKNYVIYEDIVEQMNSSDTKYIIQKQRFFTSKTSYGNTVLGLDSCTWHNAVFTDYHNVNKKQIVSSTLISHINNIDTNNDLPYYVISIPPETNEFAIKLKTQNNNPYIIKSKIRYIFLKSLFQYFDIKMLSDVFPYDKDKFYSKILYDNLPKEKVVFSDYDCELSNNKAYNDFTINDKRFIIIHKKKVGYEYEEISVELYNFCE